MTKSSYPNTKGFIKRTFNVHAWMDVDRLWLFVQHGYHMLRIWFVPQAPKHNHTSFDQALVRQGITEADLKVKQKALWRLSLFMLGMASLFLLYAIYLGAIGHGMSCLVSIILMMVAAAFAFRYHFWMFQITQRRLGCSGWDWIKYVILGKTR